MSNIYRDVTLNQVSEQDIGKTIRVAGWVENIRDHGGVSFIDLYTQHILDTRTIGSWKYTSLNQRK